MLRFRRRELTAFLGPYRVLAMRGGAKEAESFSLAVPGEDEQRAKAVDALRELFEREDCRRAPFTLIVSDFWARYVIVPEEAAIVSEDERMAYARQLFVKRYGDVAHGWEIAIEDAVGRATVACALPAALLEEVRALCAARKLSLKSLQPHLVSAARSWATQLPSSGAWLVTVEQGVLAAARLSERGWERAHVTRVDEDWGVELRRLQRLAELMQGAGGEARVLVDAPQVLRRGGDAFGGVHWLECEPRAARNAVDNLHLVRRGELCSVYP